MAEQYEMHPKGYALSYLTLLTHARAQTGIWSFLKEIESRSDVRGQRELSHALSTKLI